MNEQDKHFDKVAAQYDQVFAPHVTAHYLRKRVGLIGRLLSRGQALEVGCGTGRLMGALKPWARVTGVDLSSGMLDVLRRHGHGDAVQAVAHVLPFADDRFDVVFSVAVLHHLGAPAVVAAMLAEMVRVTKFHGRIVVWDHNPLNPYWPVVMRSAPQDRGDERLVPVREIVCGLEAAGARILKRFGSGFVPEFVPVWLMPIARAIEAIVDGIPLLSIVAAHSVVVAVK